jgi:hypothetical protein
LGNDEELILCKEGVVIDAVAEQKHELQYHQFSAGQLLTVMYHIPDNRPWFSNPTFTCPDVHFIYESIQTHETNVVPVYVELRRKYFAVGIAYVKCLQY